MQHAIPSWNGYRTTVREFDAVLEHGRAVASAWAGAALDTPQASYGEQIFNKLLGHASALRRLAADPLQAAPRLLVDLPSMSALARCIIEAHDAFDYVAGHEISASERSFRIRLWELNDATRRLKILWLLDSADPAIARIRADAARLQLGLESHAYLATLPPAEQADLRLRLRRTDPPEFHLTRRRRCELSGVDANWHKGVCLQLSQHAQTLPFSVHQLMQFGGDSPEGASLIGQPLAFSLPFIARAIHAAPTLMAGRPPVPPSRTARTMQAWRARAEPEVAAGTAG